MNAANLTLLTDLARGARDSAAQRQAQARASLEESRRQLDLLRNYARDYQRRAQSTLADGVDPAAQNNLRAFVGKLAHAIETQANEVGRRGAVLAACDGEFVQTQTRLKSLEKLAERNGRRVLQREAGREQRSTDEIAQNMHTGRRAAAESW